MAVGKAKGTASKGKKAVPVPAKKGATPKKASSGKVEARQAQLVAQEEEEVDANHASSSSSGADSSGDEGGATTTTTTTTKSADFVALSSAVQGKMAAVAAAKGSTKSKDPALSTKLPGAKKVGAATSKPGSVVYLGHVPHGFFEEQMRAFFAQFGGVKHVRLSRSKKTAKSRGFAFLEFDSPEVAAVVADTMHGYYLGGRKLVCQVLAPSQVHPKLFIHADKKWRVIPWRQLEKERRQAPKTEGDARKCLSRLLKGDNRKRRQLAKLGIAYEFPGYEATAQEAYVKRKKDDPAAGATGKGEKSEAKTGGGKGGKRRAAEEAVVAAADAVVAAPKAGRKKAKVAAADPAPAVVAASAKKGAGKRARDEEKEPVAEVKKPAAAPKKKAAPAAAGGKKK